MMLQLARAAAARVGRAPVPYCADLLSRQAQACGASAAPHVLAWVASKHSNLSYTRSAASGVLAARSRAWLPQQHLCGLPAGHACASATNSSPVLRRSASTSVSCLCSQSSDSCAGGRSSGGGSMGEEAGVPSAPTKVDSAPDELGGGQCTTAPPSGSDTATPYSTSQLRQAAGPLPPSSAASALEGHAFPQHTGRRLVHRAGPVDAFIMSRSVISEDDVGKARADLLAEPDARHAPALVVITPSRYLLWATHSYKLQPGEPLVLPDQPDVEVRDWEASPLKVVKARFWAVHQHRGTLRLGPAAPYVVRQLYDFCAFTMITAPWSSVELLLELLLRCFARGELSHRNALDQIMASASLRLSASQLQRCHSWRWNLFSASSGLLLYDPFSTSEEELISALAPLRKVAPRNEGGSGNDFDALTLEVLQLSKDFTFGSYRYSMHVVEQISYLKSPKHGSAVAVDWWRFWAFAASHLAACSPVCSALLRSDTGFLRNTFILLKYRPASEVRDRLLRTAIQNCRELGEEPLLVPASGSSAADTFHQQQQATALAVLERMTTTHPNDFVHDQRLIWRL